MSSVHKILAQSDTTAFSKPNGCVECTAYKRSFSTLESKRTKCSTYDLPGSPRSFSFPLTHIQIDHSIQCIDHPQDGILNIKDQHHGESPLQQKWPKSLLHSTPEQTGCIRLQTSQLSTTLAASGGQGRKNPSGAKVNGNQSIPTCSNVLAKLSRQHDRSSTSKLEQRSWKAARESFITTLVKSTTLPLLNASGWIAAIAGNMHERHKTQFHVEITRLPPQESEKWTPDQRLPTCFRHLIALAFCK